MKTPPPFIGPPYMSLFSNLCRRVDWKRDGGFSSSGFVISLREPDRGTERGTFMRKLSSSSHVADQPCAAGKRPLPRRRPPGEDDSEPSKKKEKVGAAKDKNCECTMCREACSATGVPRS